MECFSYTGGCGTHLYRQLKKELQFFGLQLNDFGQLQLIVIYIKQIYHYIQGTKEYCMLWYVVLSNHVKFTCEFLFFTGSNMIPSSYSTIYNFTLSHVSTRGYVERAAMCHVMWPCVLCPCPTWSAHVRSNQLHVATRTMSQVV